MPLPFLDSWRALTHPREAFREPQPSLGAALGRMAAVWIPLALANTLLTCWRALQSYEGLRKGGLPLDLLATASVDPAVVEELLKTLPPAVPLTRLLPWLLVLVPLGVLGTWLHHAVWDHTGLWLLGGLKTKRGFRTSLIAEAEALRHAALGTLVGLLSFLPLVGGLLSLPLMLLGGYLWLFRGFALAARHGCELWKGLVATVIHAVLLGCCAIGLLTCLLVLLRVGG